MISSVEKKALLVPRRALVLHHPPILDASLYRLDPAVSEYSYEHLCKQSTWPQPSSWSRWIFFLFRECGASRRNVCSVYCLFFQLNTWHQVYIYPDGTLLEIKLL